MDLRSVQPRLMRQGRPDFSVGLKLQSIWGLREAVAFSVEGWAATMMIASATAGWLPGMIAAELVMMVAVVLLFSHLGNPRAAWRTIANFRRSWISRGTAMIGAFVGLGAVAILSSLLPVPAAIVSGIYWLQIVTAVFILFYPGFAMGASAGIPFWQSGLLPILSCLGGLSSGGIAALASGGAQRLFHVSFDVSVIATLVLLAVIAICVFALYAASQRMSAAAQMSGQRLVRVEKLWFWGLAVGVGLLVPALIFVAVLISSSGGVAVAVGLVVAAAARVLGDVAFRYSVLRVGAYEALL
jgi:formate-dependent nitrite reductase membrane component NrfD